MAEGGCGSTVGAGEKMLLGGQGCTVGSHPKCWQLEFANVPVKEWIINPSVHGLLDGPSDVVCLPVHYGEIVHSDVMPRG